MSIKDRYDVIVIGSGPGGLAAAISAKKNGAKDVLIIERDVEPGGILLQCIHNGFGVEIFKKDLPGPSYAQHFINEAFSTGVEFLLDTMVLQITPEKRITASSKRHGFVEVRTKAIVLAMGCRERTRAQIRLPGTRAAGIFTAGTAQRWVNVEGYMPGKNFVILGSGDIGMIMARRLTFEGAHVERVLEVMPYLSGLTRNYVQCLLDFDIQLQLQRTIKNIIGKKRVEAIESVAVDKKWNPIPGTEEIIPCDTLLLSVGLIPENELSRQIGVMIDPITGGPIVDDSFQTNIPGIFSAGNVVHVYDLVDWVTEAGLTAGKSAARWVSSGSQTNAINLPVRAGENVRYAVPHTIQPDHLAEGDIRVQMRVRQPIEKPVWVEVRSGEKLLHRKGEPYARPGEMVTIPIKQKLMDEVKSAKDLTIAIVER
ncbi:MAG: pyridine nucleotide-disulfide oxidoreductase [Chloroflexi bacterium 44-23]|nr:MAG: pyridine nucleotide-disulfide oxidoreductase [Chloroflexi bacterium 44-23]